MSESVQGALAPLSHADAEELVRACVPLARRLSPEGVAGVAAVLASLGQVMTQHPEISEIDVNPLLVDSERAVALDALIVVDRKTDESPVPATSER